MHAYISGMIDYQQAYMHGLTCNAQEDAFLEGSVEDVLCDDVQ